MITRDLCGSVRRKNEKLSPQFPVGLPGDTLGQLPIDEQYSLLLGYLRDACQKCAQFDANDNNVNSEISFGAPQTRAFSRAPSSCLTSERESKSSLVSSRVKRVVFSEV